MKKSRWFLYGGNIWCLNGVLIFFIGALLQTFDPVLIAGGLGSVILGAWSIFEAIRLAERGE